ncbi:hypothetical protein RUND412_005838 [Rhizina undulata]
MRLRLNANLLHQLHPHPVTRDLQEHIASGPRYRNRPPTDFESDFRGMVLSINEGYDIALTPASNFPLPLLFWFLFARTAFVTRYGFKNSTASPLFEPFDSNSTSSATLGYLLLTEDSKFCASGYNFCAPTSSPGCCKAESQCFVSGGVAGCKRYCPETQVTCANKTCCSQGYVCGDPGDSWGTVCEIDPRFQSVQLPVQIATDNTPTSVGSVSVLNLDSSVGFATASAAWPSGSYLGVAGLVVQSYNKTEIATGLGDGITASAVGAALSGVVVGFMVLLMGS